MYRINVSELARQDMDDTALYIAEELGAPKAATDLMDGIKECLEFLQDNPMMYPKCRDEGLEGENYRKAPVKNYLVIYKVNKTAKIVRVYRIFHSRQDYAQLL